MPESIPRAEPSVLADHYLMEDGTNFVVRDMREKLTKIYPSARPLVVLTSRAKSKRRTATYYKFEWQEIDKYPRRLTSLSNQTAASQTIDWEAGHGTKAAKNYVLMNTRTREQVFLPTDPASDQVTDAIRGIGGGQAAIVAGDVWEIQGAIHAELTTLGSIRSINPTQLFNHCEILRTPVGYSGRAAKTKYYGGPQPTNLRSRAGLEHQISQERRALFGKRHSRDTGATGLQTFTGGLEYYIKSHVWDLAGQEITERSLVEWLEMVMELGDGGYINRGGDGMKWLFCGNALITSIEFFARPLLRYEPLSSKIGMRAAQFTSSAGTLNIMRHPQLVNEHAGWGFVVDMNHFGYVNFDGRDTMFLDNRQNPSLDGREQEWLTDFGWEIQEEFAHAIVKNNRVNV